LQQPVHVDDVADAIVAALHTPAAVRKTYEVAGPNAITFRELIAHASAALGKPVRTFPVPLRPVVALATLAERTGRSPLRAEQFERLGEDKAFDISAARADLGFAPRTFAEGVAAEVAMLR
jgi:nucleoside-diphosphate-sugar epimerase